MKRMSSRRRTGWPIMAFIASSRSGVGAGGEQHRLDDVLVAGAAAEVAVEAGSHLGLVQPLAALDEIQRAHDHAGRAEAALKRVGLLERRLQRMQRAGRAQ